LLRIVEIVVCRVFRLLLGFSLAEAVFKCFLLGVLVFEFPFVADAFEEK
jgi:hypothetical protein